MRLIFILFTILGAAFPAFAQTQRLASIPADGCFLDRGWKFTTDDSAVYADPGYDDSRWQSVNLSGYNDYVTRLKNLNIGWFRLLVLMDSSVRNKNLAIQISQLGASEIYLNGKLFQTLGSIRTRQTAESFNPLYKPLLLPGDSGDSLLIAIRFASKVPAKLWLFTDAHKSPLKVVINSWNDALRFYKSGYEQIEAETRFSYLFVALAFLFILLFVFFPKEKINLLFGVFCVFAVIRTYLVYQLSQENFDMNHFGFTSYLMNLNDAILGILTVSIICYAVFKRIPFYYQLLIAGIGLDLGLFLVFGPTLFQVIVDFMFRLFTVIGFFHLGVLAFRKKIYTIGTVAIISSLLNLTFFLFFFQLNTGKLHAITDSDYVRYALTVNFIMTTVYVATNFARKSKNLEKQLVQIDKLSQDNLNKEREKQQMLASQNATLEQEVSQRTIALTRSLENLKSAQSQLIHAEKMASLGELTAGIAHEIQNPLNFVNNFSDLNKELLEELKGEVDKGNLDEVKELAGNVIDNEQKINFHGRRADSIVKGMLQHSRQTSAVREPTDINALCDEYLRLSYHGLRAKDRAFNADFKTDLDVTVGTCRVIPQDIGRVLLNLYNNAFYAVNEKAKLLVRGYQPVVEVRTRKMVDGIEIIVMDNGNGIPKNIIDKIFQPFFTTKPTGEGTGLGLSLAYDIITKEHRGTIKAESNMGHGTTFTIQLVCS